jgi:succinyl-CoA synthetase beta subunit
MRLLEYQGKELFQEYGLRVPKSVLAINLAEARIGAKKIGYPLILKSQLTVGGRGKAGAIQKCKSEGELEQKFNELLHKEVKGELPRGILLEQMADIKKELYLSIFLNRGKRCYSLISSSEGGIDIESAANRVVIDIQTEELTQEMAEDIGSKLGLQGRRLIAAVDFITKLWKMTMEKEAELAEVNPVAILGDDSMLALDSKVIIDDNAMFRHPELKKYEHISELEKQAKTSGFSLVELDGNVAIIGNGAGLVMSTLDMVSDAGGKAGAFLDFGGKATTETIYEALKVISQIKNIQVIMVNLFGGIVRTNLVAQAILDAYENNLIAVPVFARISGAESEKAREMLRGSKANLYDTVEQAIQAAVAAAHKGDH